MSARDDAIEAAYEALRRTRGYRPHDVWRADAEAALNAAIPVLLAPLRELHREDTTQAITGLDCLREECDHDGDCPTSDVSICAHCWAVAEAAYAYVGEERIPEEIRWPCATVRLLDQIEGKA